MGKNKQLQDYVLISGQTNPRNNKQKIIDQRGMLADRSNTLEFYKSTGNVTYIDRSGKNHTGHFGPRDNGYLLLSLLIQYPGKIYTADQTAEVLNKAREYSDSTPDRRARDTIQTIRKELGLVKDKVNDFFIVDKGFGLNCKVEIKP